METNELVDMLKIIRDSAEPIQTPDANCGYSTLIKDVKCDDSFTWVIDEAIKALSSGNKKGKWHHSGECSVCHKRSYKTTPLGEIIGIDFTDFCKNCGADMR